AEAAVLSPGSFAVTVSTSQNVNVFVVAQTRAGVTVLHPAAGGGEPIAPGGRVRVPASGGFISLGLLEEGDRLCITTLAEPAKSARPCEAGATPIRWSL